MINETHPWKSKGNKSYPTRSEARDMGQAKYWSDRPCPVGHPGWKMVHNGECAECRAIRMQARRIGGNIEKGAAICAIEARRDAKELDRLLRGVDWYFV